MARLYSRDHVYVGATYVELSQSLARTAKRRGTARIPADTKVEVLEVICIQCRRPFDAVDGKPCAAADDTTRDHLIGGPSGSSATGERKKRKHPGGAAAEDTDAAAVG